MPVYPHCVSPTAASEDRLSRAEVAARRLDTPLSVLGLLLVLLVLAQNLAQDPALVAALSIVGWVLWAEFVAGFALRAVIARDHRRNWWQALFLAVPFLRFLRAVALVRVLRVARVGGVVSAALRNSRVSRCRPRAPRPAS